MKLDYKKLRYVAAGSVSFTVGILAFVIFWSFTNLSAEYVIFLSLIFCVIAACLMFGITYDCKPRKKKANQEYTVEYKVPFYTFPKE